jgi:hypothetical protein
MEIQMKAFYKLAGSATKFTTKFALTLALMTCSLAASALAQAAVPEVAPPTAALANVTEGQGVIVSSGNPQWDGLSEIVLIPGASLMGPSSSKTGLYIGFTGGSEADIDNMVLYSTPRNGTTITAIKKLKLGGVSNPSIVLTNKSVCPVQPVSATNPCIVRLDTVSGALSPLDDYYFVIYFTLDSNNEHISGVGSSFAAGSLSGWALYGDQTRIGKDGAVPNGNAGVAPFFLLYLVNQ